MNSLFTAIQHAAGLLESLLICALYAGFLVTIPLAFFYDLSTHSHCCNRNLRNPWKVNYASRTTDPQTRTAD